MAEGHAHAFHVAGDSPLHRLAPECKVAAAVLFVLAVVATPREALWAYGVHAGVLAGLLAVARVPAGVVARRLALGVPFVAFAVFLPFVTRGPRVDVAGVALSVGGLWAAWNVAVKATLGLATTVVLAATTEVPALLRGLERLRVPRSFTAVAGFMVRYAEVIGSEVRRMSVARQSRGYDPRWFWQAKAVAASAGALFIRSYERGERVYLAMVARGYTGALPVLADDGAPARQWAVALALPAVGAGVALAAWWAR